MKKITTQIDKRLSETFEETRVLHHQGYQDALYKGIIEILTGLGNAEAIDMEIARNTDKIKLLLKMKETLSDFEGLENSQSGDLEALRLRAAGDLLRRPYEKWEATNRIFLKDAGKFKSVEEMKSWVTEKQKTMESR